MIDQRINRFLSLFRLRLSSATASKRIQLQKPPFLFLASPSQRSHSSSKVCPHDEHKHTKQTHPGRSRTLCRGDPKHVYQNRPPESPSPFALAPVSPQPPKTHAHPTPPDPIDPGIPRTTATLTMYSYFVSKGGRRGRVASKKAASSSFFFFSPLEPSLLIRIGLGNHTLCTKRRAQARPKPPPKSHMAPPLLSILLTHTRTRPTGWATRRRGRRGAWPRQGAQRSAGPPSGSTRARAPPARPPAPAPSRCPGGGGRPPPPQHPPRPRRGRG